MKPSRPHRSLMAIVACVIGLTVVAAPAAGHAPERAHRSVIGGTPADPAQFPYSVAIFRKGHMHCSGAVIGPTKVLTAAHCLLGFNLANFQVIVGRPDLRNASAGLTVGVTGGHAHPDFEQTALHDVGVLTLAEPVTVAPVALPTPDIGAATTVPGSQLQVSGYGATKPFGVHLSPFLKTTTEIVRPEQRCLRAYTRDLFAPESMICALGAKRKHGGKFKIHTSACAGDSGGPLVATTLTGPVVVGTVSFGGALCGLPGAPTVYSRVASSLDFINGA
jgi:secreted trypsin-like serine protease